MKRTIKLLTAFIATVILVVAVYGVAIEPRFRMDVRDYHIVIDDLPPALAGTRLAVFSDIQVGMWWANTDMVERVVDRAVDERPDAVLIVGDFLYSREPDVPAQLDAIQRLMRPLSASDIPTFAVLGNHDYAADAAEALTELLTDQGIRVLHNEPAILSGAAQSAPPLHVVGIGPRIPGQADPEAAFDDVPDDAPRVVMMHNPATFPHIPPHRAPLAVAGHTHCGQIAVPGFPAWSWLELRADERIVVDGFAPPDYGAPGNRLYVTCGIGFSLLPMRVSAPPQLVFFELAAGDP